MILIKPSYEILAIMIEEIAGEPLKLIELAGRTCYKSEDKITADSSKKFVQMVIKRGHHSVIEHSAMTVKFIIDRGISHELVRHRLCAFSQESTRYCNYKGGVTFVIPPWVDIGPGEYLHKIDERYGGNITNITWAQHMLDCEYKYIRLLSSGFNWTPQQARSVLPNSLKTEIVVTANFREWRHIFNLRCSEAAHPQMREIMIPLRNEMATKIPEIFGFENLNTTEKRFVELPGFLTGLWF